MGGGVRVRVRMVWMGGSRWGGVWMGGAEWAIFYDENDMK